MTTLNMVCARQIIEELPNDIVQALWKHFIQYYYEAYDIALCNAMKRQLS